MRVYKFLSTRWAMDNLEKRWLKASDPENLNDPFDFLAVDMTDSSYRQQVLDRLKLVLSDKVLCCFSNAATDPLLWAHYSDCHRGICLAFEIDDHVAGRMREVKYVGKRLTPAQVQTNSSVAELLFIKFAAWSYEGEVRAFLPRDKSAAAGELTFIPFDTDLVLKDVILGHKCTSNVADVNSKLVGYPFDITVLRAHPSLSDFRMHLTMERDSANSE